jgi:hypothetical protein
VEYSTRVEALAVALLIEALQWGNSEGAHATAVWQLFPQTDATIRRTRNVVRVDVGYRMTNVLIKLLLLLGYDGCDSDDEFLFVTANNCPALLFIARFLTCYGGILAVGADSNWKR